MLKMNCVMNTRPQQSDGATRTSTPSRISCIGWRRAAGRRAGSINAGQAAPPRSRTAPRQSRRPARRRPIRPARRRVPDRWRTRPCAPVRSAHSLPAVAAEVTSDGTRAGAATLKTTVPVAAAKPSRAKSGTESEAEGGAQQERQQNERRGAPRRQAMSPCRAGPGRREAPPAARGAGTAGSAPRRGAPSRRRPRRARGPRRSAPAAERDLLGGLSREVGPGQPVEGFRQARGFGRGHGKIPWNCDFRHFRPRRRSNPPVSRQHTVSRTARCSCK